MKTFEEAFGSCVVLMQHPTPEEVCAAQAQLTDDSGRIRPLIEEALDYEPMVMLLAAFGQSGAEGAINAFVLGLRIGMEMEKNPTGGVLVE